MLLMYIDHRIQNNIFCFIISFQKVQFIVTRHSNTFWMVHTSYIPSSFPCLYSTVPEWLNGSLDDIFCLSWAKSQLRLETDDRQTDALPLHQIHLLRLYLLTNRLNSSLVVYSHHRKSSTAARINFTMYDALYVQM